VPASASGTVPEIFRYAELDSTNAEALRQAKRGQVAAWFLAESQVQGRGRHGRQWSSRPGGLFATHLLVLDLPVRTLVALTFVAGIAVHQTAAAHVPASIRPDLLLKWPNDLLAGGAKLAGILIQTEPLSAGKTAIAIGVGLNVANDVKTTSGQAASLAQLGGSRSVNSVFSTLAAAMTEQISLWNEGQGLSAVLAAWQDRAMIKGTATQVRLPQGTIKGTYAGLDASGGLLLRLDEGLMRTIHAGDIVISPPQTEAGAHP